jgi:hypothetical protein
VKTPPTDAGIWTAPGLSVKAEVLRAMEKQIARAAILERGRDEDRAQERRLLGQGAALRVAAHRPRPDDGAGGPRPSTGRLERDAAGAGPERVWGNDADLSALLIALLRAQSTPTRYVQGTIELAGGCGSPS